MKLPTIICHADANSLGIGSAHGDVLHWFPKYGKSMDTVREDVAELLKPATTPSPVSDELYRIRKSWDNTGSQQGAYRNLDNAKTACDKAGPEYYVFNSAGVAVYPEVKEEEVEAAKDFKVGDKVVLVSGATYYNGASIPTFVLQTKPLYVRNIYSNGNIVISTQATGAITGVVKPASLLHYDESAPTPESYVVRINTDVLNVRAGAGTGYKILRQVVRNTLHTVVEEKSDWGRLLKGGWVSLEYTQKIK